MSPFAPGRATISPPTPAYRPVPPVIAVLCGFDVWTLSKITCAVI